MSDLEAQIAFVARMLTLRGNATPSEHERLEAIANQTDRFDFDGLPEPDPDARLYHPKEEPA